MIEKKSKTLLEQIHSYQFINKGISLHKILKDINLNDIVDMDISKLDADIVKSVGLLDYDDLPFLMKDYTNLKLMIDRFIKEGLDLSKYTITEQPIANCYCIESEHENNSKKTGEPVGIDINIEDGIAVPFHVDNHTNLPYNMFKANSITEAFEKSNF